MNYNDMMRNVAGSTGLTRRQADAQGDPPGPLGSGLLHLHACRHCSRHRFQRLVDPQAAGPTPQLLKRRPNAKWDAGVLDAQIRPCPVA